MQNILHNVTPHMPMAEWVSTALIRLLLASLIGGMIGLERELARKPAGLRTNMFICFGACLYTMLSFRYAGPTPDEHIAAQIIPGIGFIGAGSILRDKGGVTGLTTAATLFVVASLGMAVGGGEYLVAIFGAMIILVGLEVLGRFESRFNFKPISSDYEVASPDAERAVSEVNHALDEMRLIMSRMVLGGDEKSHRLQFTVDATRREQKALFQRLKSSDAFTRVELRRGAEHE